MKARTTTRKAASAGEPMGIVISRGRDVEAVPVFSAYMYAPVPQPEPADVRELAGV